MCLLWCFDCGCVLIVLFAGWWVCGVSLCFCVGDLFCFLCSLVGLCLVAWFCVIVLLALQYLAANCWCL